MRKTKRVIAALTAAIITATSTSLMSVCADENGGSDFGFVSKSTTNKSDNIEAVESDAQLYDKLGQLLKDGDSLKYGEALYTTGTPYGEKWTKEFYEQRVEFYGEDLLSKYIVDGEFLRKSVESDMNGLLNKTENELDKYVDIINEYLISNSIAGSAYAIKNDGVDKLLITYDGQLEKIQAYIAEKGIDEDLVVYEQGHDMIVTQPATTIAVTETKPVITITMPVVDEPTIQTEVVTVTIMDISGDNILVKPVDGSPELKSSSKFYLSSKKLPDDIKPKVGMKLEITYNGGILETYPAQFGNVKKVVEVKEDTVKEGATWLKGTKDMTLKDVMRLAELGDELDWADFKDYNGRDVGSGLHIWEYKLEDGYVLDVGGDVMKKPLYILLSHDNDKGIDIRTEDVKEYIASTAAPVSENSENIKLKATAESVSKFMSENGISGYAYVGKADGVEKIYIPYAGDLEKLKTYVAEKGIDESLVVYQLSDWNNYGSGQSSGNKEVQKPLISEDDILDLSKKGDELTWSDFEKYEFTDIGDGTNIWQFVIKNSGSKLLVIGRNLKEKPEHINFVWGNGAEFDIRTEDLTPWFYDDALVVKGDANCDGQVDLSDAVMIMQALANPNKYGIDGTAEHHLTEQGKLNGDMDGDGLTVGDAQAIQKKLLGLENVEAQSVESFLTANAGFLNEKGTYTLFFIRNGNYFSRAGGSADTHDEGTWTISGDTVVLTGKFGTNRLSFDDNALIYIAEGSDGFSDFNPKDGEKFNAVFE